MTINFKEYELLSEAADLLSEDGENPEYDRAIVELTMRLAKIDSDHRDKVAACLRSLHDVKRIT
jgi:hypothetical protein